MIKNVSLRCFGILEHKIDAYCTTAVDGTHHHPRRIWWDGVNVDMKSFNLSQEDAQVSNKCGLEIKEHLASPGEKMVCVCVCVCNVCG